MKQYKTGVVSGVRPARVFSARSVNDARDAYAEFEGFAHAEDMETCTDDLVYAYALSERRKSRWPIDQWLILLCVVSACLWVLVLWWF